MLRANASICNREREEEEEEADKLNPCVSLFFSSFAILEDE
jgi:hypothetical protein